MAEFPLPITTELWLDGAWVDISGDVRTDAMSIKRGRADEAGTADPSKLSLKLDNRNGRYSPRNPHSPHYGRLRRNVPIRVSVDGTSRIVAEVSEWPPRWDTSGNNAWVPLKAAGIKRRLSQRASPLRSSVRRFMDGRSPGPIAYWALDAGELSTVGRVTSGEGGVWTPLSGETSFGDVELAPWLPPGVTMDEEATMAASTSSVPANSAISVDHIRRAREGGSGPSTLTFSGRDANDDFFDWIITLTPGDFDFIEVQLVSAPSVDVWGPVDAPSLFTSDIHHVRFALEESGSSTDFTIYVDGELVMSDTTTAGVFTRLNNELLSSYTPGSDDEDLAQGHWAVWVGGPSVIPSVDDMTEVMRGHRGETAADRIERLSDEEGVPIAIEGGGDTVMGPQYRATYLEIMRECEVADLGALTEQRSQLGLRYRARDTLYSQTPALVLDYSNGEIAPSVEPIDDDQATVNDVLVEREGGGEARVVDEDGPLGVDMVGRYDDSVTLNVQSDDQLDAQASWRLHLGTVDELRIPTLTLNLRNPRMAQHHDAVMALDTGDRIQVLNPPDWVGGSTLDLIVQGYEETLGLHQWEMTLNCTPASAWTVWTIAPLDQVSEGFEDDDLIVTVADGDGSPDWARTDAHARTGTWSLGVQGVADGESSAVDLTGLPEGAVTLSLWAWVEGSDQSSLTIEVDGTQVESLPGEATTPAWEQAEVDVAGATTVTLICDAVFAATDAYVDDLVVSVAAPTQVSRLDTSGSELALAADMADTELVVATDSPGRVWITTAGRGQDLPMRLQMGGEVVRVTGVTGEQSPQTMTVERAVNGVSKSHPAGTRVRLARTEES